MSAGELTSKTVNLAYFLVSSSYIKPASRLLLLLGFSLFCTSPVFAVNPGSTSSRHSCFPTLPLSLSHTRTTANMKYAIAASSLAAASLAAAAPQQFGNNGNRGPPNGDNNGNVGGWNGAPSCVSSCWQDLSSNSGNYADFCTGDQLNTLNTCIGDSDCSDDDKEATYQVIAQGCANAGQTPTASQQASWSATSGKNIPTPGGGNSGGPWRGGQGRGDWTTNSDWQSWTSAHPTPTVTDSAAWSSWYSSAGWPTASSEWSSWASAKGLPTSVGGGFPFGFGGPGPFSSVVLYCLSSLASLCPI